MRYEIFVLFLTTFFFPSSENNKLSQEINSLKKWINYFVKEVEKEAQQRLDFYSTLEKKLEAEQQKRLDFYATLEKKFNEYEKKKEVTTNEPRQLVHAQSKERLLAFLAPLLTLPVLSTLLYLGKMIFLACIAALLMWVFYAVMMQLPFSTVDFATIPTESPVPAPGAESGVGKEKVDPVEKLNNRSWRYWAAIGTLVTCISTFAIYRIMSKRPIRPDEPSPSENESDRSRSLEILQNLPLPPGPTYQDAATSPPGPTYQDAATSPLRNAYQDAATSPRQYNSGGTNEGEPIPTASLTLIDPKTPRVDEADVRHLVELSGELLDANERHKSEADQIYLFIKEFKMLNSFKAWKKSLQEGETSASKRLRDIWHLKADGSTSSADPVDGKEPKGAFFKSGDSPRNSEHYPKPEVHPDSSSGNDE